VGLCSLPHPLPSGVASYVARNRCKHLRLATASTSENFSPRGAHEKACAILVIVVGMTTTIFVGVNFAFIEFYEVGKVLRGSGLFSAYASACISERVKAHSTLRNGT
jgi:hypothetical protein